MSRKAESMLNEASYARSPIEKTLSNISEKEKKDN